MYISIFLIAILKTFSLKTPTPFTRIKMIDTNINKLPKDMVSNFTINKLENYNVKEVNKVMILDDLSRPFPNVTFDLMIYNTAQISKLEAADLDRLIIKSQDRLNTLGVLVIDIPEQDYISYPYWYLLENPKELWEYNLVSIEIDTHKITARKGSSMVFKDRYLEKIASVIANNTLDTSNDLNITDFRVGFITFKTGNENIDLVVNMIGMFLQYTFLFNFFSFGIMMLIQTYFSGGP